MKKKIILMLCVLALFVCIFAISVSAGGYDFVVDRDYEYEPNDYIDISCSDIYNGYSICYVTGDCFAFQPGPFKKLIDGILYEVTFENFIAFCDEHYNDTGDSFLGIWMNELRYSEDYFNKLYYYEEPIDATSFSVALQAAIENYVSYCSSENISPTSEGFSEYLQEGYASLYEVYNKGAYKVSQEMFNAGVASSNSSSGSHGSSASVANPGAHYGESHGDEPISSDCCYNPGYNDGLADGGDTYKQSESYQSDINNKITEYMNSEEYQSLMTDYSTEVINEYLRSEEYTSSMNASFESGKEVGKADALDAAYSDVYEIGKINGYNEFRASSEYGAAVNSAYGSGYNNGVNAGKESVVNPAGVIALLAIAIFLGLIIFVIAKVGKNKHKKK